MREIERLSKLDTVAVGDGNVDSVAVSSSLESGVVRPVLTPLLALVKGNARIDLLSFAPDPRNSKGVVITFHQPRERRGVGMVVSIVKPGRLRVSAITSGSIFCGNCLKSGVLSAPSAEGVSSSSMMVLSDSFVCLRVTGCGGDVKGSLVTVPLVLCSIVLVL